MLIGLPGADESEGFDRTHMSLPANQIAALHAVAAANPDVVVVLVNGSTVELGEVVPHARALVEAWLGGQAAGGRDRGRAVRRRSTRPGRLAETVPHRLEDNSSYLNFPGDSRVVRYGEGLFIGYRGYDASHTDVAFPFGFGLSYTTFALSDLDVAMSGSVADGQPGRRGDGHRRQHRTGGRRRGRAGLRPRRRGLGRPAGARAQGLRQGRPWSRGSPGRSRSAWTSARSRSGPSCSAGGWSRPASSRSRSARIPATCP